MFKLALVGLGLWGGHRYLKAQDVGVPLDAAFKFENWLTSIPDLKAQSTAQLGPSPSPAVQRQAAETHVQQYGPSAVEPAVPERDVYADYDPDAALDPGDWYYQE